MTLGDLRIRNVESNYNNKPENKLKIMAPWLDDEGDEFMDWLGCPKEFAYNEKSAFWNRIAALAGFARTLNEEDLQDFDITVEGVPEGSQDPWADLQAVMYTPDGTPRVGADGRPVQVAMRIKYKGEDLIGKQAILNLKPKFDQQGNLVDGNKIAADGAMPIGMAGGKKKGGQAFSAPATPNNMP